MTLLRRSAHGGWGASDLEVVLHDTPVSMLEDLEGDVWISTLRDGVSQFRWSTGTEERLISAQLEGRYRPGLGLPREAIRPLLELMGNRMFALTQEGILGLRTDKLGFEPVPELAAFVGMAASPAHSGLKGETAFWIVHSRNWPVLDPTVFCVWVNSPSGAVSWQPVEVPGSMRWAS